MDNLGILIQAILSLKDTTDSKNQIAKELPKLESQLQSDKNTRVKIVAGLDVGKSKNLIQSQLNTLTNQAKAPTVKIGIDASGLNSVQGATQNITNGLRDIQTQAQQTSQSIINLSDKFKAPIKPVFNKEGLIDAEKTILRVQQHFQELGEISVKGQYGDKNAVDSLDSMIVKIQNGQKEARTLTFELDKAGKAFYLKSGTSDNSGIAKLSTQIEETRVKYNRLLSDFKSSNSAIQSGLTHPIQQFETVLNGLGKTSSINDVKNAFESLKQSASEITAYLDTTNSSFNKATNAVNNYKNMDNILKEMTASFNNLVMKPENLRIELDGVKTKLIELQSLEKTEGGYTKAWAEKYREVNLELAQVKTNIELALKAEGSSQKADKNSAYQTQLKYLNKIKEETNTIIYLKRKMVNAGDEEKSVYQHEITNAQKRIQYDTQQLEKKKLLTDEAKRLVNTYKEQIALQDKINSAKTSDKNIQVQSQQLKDYVTQVSKAITQLNSLQDSTTFNKNASNPKVTQTKQEIAQLLAEYQKLMTQMQGNITPEGLIDIGNQLTQLNARFNTAYTSAKNFETELKKDNGAEKLAQKVALLTSRIKAYQSANTKAGKKYGSEFQQMLGELSDPRIDDKAYNRINKHFQTLRQEINATGMAGKTFFQTIGDQIKKFSSWMTLTGIISGLWREMRQMVTNVIELDSAMTNLKKVTDETESTYNRFLKNTIQQAKELKMDLSDLVNQTAEWAKKGYDINKSAIASKASGIYSVVGEVDNKTAVQDLTTVIKSYNMAVEDSIEIVDRFNNISNKYSVTAADIGTMLSNSISSLSIAGNTLDEAIAMGTTITEITGDASEAGNTLKVLSMRLRGASTEIESAGESTDGMAESTSKLREKILALTNVTGNGGFDIMADANNFKSTYEIIQGISEVWNDISNVNQAALIELIAGKQRGNTVSALLTNMAQANKILNDSVNSSGSAMKEYELYLNSIDGKIQGLTTSFQSLSQTVINSELVKFVVDFGTTTLNTLDNIISKFGTIPTLLGSIATVGAFKNVGEQQNTPVYAQPQFICA